MAKHCIRKKRTRAGLRCAKFAGGSLGRRGGRHCLRMKRTRAGKRCAKFA